MKPKSPLPFRYIRFSAESCNIRGANRSNVADYVLEQDAAYIVHACNLYPELVEALQAVWDVAKDVPSVSNRAELVTQVRAALAKARAE